MIFDGRTYNHEETIAAGQGAVIELPERTPSMVGVHPAEGATATVEFSISSRDRVQAGTARWIAWAYGSVTQSTLGEFIAPITAVRVIAAAGAVVVEVQQ